MVSDRFYRTPAWAALRAERLRRDHHMCQACKRAGRLVSASIVHHVIARADAPERAMDIENLESLCGACHNRIHPEKGFHSKVKKSAGAAQSGARIIKM